jgi:phospholipid/cholesterol/gamma-HCH transport system substrate-binding protein
MKLSNELKTGVVVILAVTSLLVVLFQTGDIQIGKKGHIYKSQFGYAAGLKKFAPVNLAGIEIGEVTDLHFVYKSDKTLVEAEFWVREDVKLRNDSLAMVSTLGLMGEKYVEIKPGISTDFLSPGETIPTEDPIGIEDLLETFQGVADNLNDTLDDMRGLTGDMRGLISNNRGKISNILDNLEITSEYFSEFAEDVKYHPWKVLSKGKEKTKEEIAKLRAERLTSKKLQEEGPTEEPIQISEDVKAEEKEPSKRQRRGR